MVYSDLSERYIPRTEDHYSRLLDVPDSSSSPPVYSDMWRSCTPEKPETSRTSPECANGSYTGPGNGYDVENFTNVITFSPCTPSYKDFTLLKDKSGHDVTDALLSLKNAVVHPSYGSQLSPLSPTMHLGPITPAGLPGSMSVPSQQPLTYTVNHSTQVHPMGYSGRASPQFPAVQIHSDHLNPHGHHHQQHGMFPSMSVNVSMSMNVVPPNFGNNQCNQAQQWQPQPAAQHYGIAHEYPHMPQDSLQPQYSPYSQNYYTSSYSLAPEFRSSVSESRNLYYKMADDFKTSPRFYNPSHIKRSKFIEEKPMGLGSHSPDNSKLNLCRICGKTYARPSTLKTHLRTHSGEKPYKCNACSKSFSQAANLTAHARTHSGEKPFHCPVCDRHFSQSSSVTTHMRTHSGERPYRCRLCKKAFSDSSTLTKHLRIHSGEKPYQCKLCLLRFSQSGNLNRHMRVHSNNG